MSAYGVDNYDDYWRNFGNKKDHDTRNQRFMVDLVKRNVAPGGAVLDCGVGAARYYQALLPNYKMRGIELSPERIANYTFDKSGIKCADLEKPLPDFGMKFDGAIVSFVIHHLRDPRSFMANLHGQLKTGGKAFIVHPNVVYHKHRLDLLMGRWPKLSTSHRVFVTPKALRQVLAQTGYDVQSVSGQKWKPWPEVFARNLFYVCAKR